MQTLTETKPSSKSVLFRLRHYRSSDHRALTRVWRSAALVLDDTDSADSIEYNRRRDNFVIFVVEAQVVNSPDEARPERWRLAGGVIVTNDGRRAYVYHLGVAPDYRGFGLGKALLQACEQQARQWGLKRMRLSVRNEESRDRARKIYEAAGWAPDNEATIYKKTLRGE